MTAGGQLSGDVPCKPAWKAEGAKRQQPRNSQAKGQSERFSNGETETVHNFCEGNEANERHIVFFYFRLNSDVIKV